ncbi:MAG: 30S ribosomal protein S9 [Planctomycetota bacterium]
MAEAQKQFIWGLGRRKTSVARVRIAPGTGKVLVNKRPLAEYFPVERRQRDVLGPLKSADALDRYDVFVNVNGGGETGQAGACVLGIARALIKAEPELEPRVRPYGFLTRDSRMVERKKYGLRKARRGCQFSKR